MRAVILAAGEGRRLSQIGWNKPKCLLEFGQQTLLDNIVNSLLEQGIDRIAIVLGYQKQVLSEVIQKYPVHWDIVINENYADTNTINSLWLARDYLTEDFIYFNADVLFDRRIIPLLLAYDHSAMAVQIKKCGAEEVKVIVDSDNLITRIGKKLDADECLGEFIGIAKFAESACSSLVESLHHYNEQLEQQQLFFETAVNDILAEHPFIAVPVGDFTAIEIDTPDDYRCAQQLDVSTWAG